MKQVIFYLLAAILISTNCFSQELKPFPLSSVRLLDGPFKQAQQVDLEYIKALDPDRLLAPYLIDAGIPVKAKRYGNWENTGLDGHIGGHYLTALSLMYASTGDEEAKKRLDYMINELAKCQEKNGNGYVGGVPDGQKMWEEIKKGDIDAGGFSLNHKWVPLYNIHKIYAGLRDAYLIGGNEKAKGMLIKLTDWCIDLTANLSDAQVQDILRSEHGGLNEVFADVTAITGEDKYLELAKRFSHEVILDPLLHQEDKLTGLHANTQIPKIIGFKRVAEVAKDSTWANASNFFWETVVNKRTVSIGGNSVREHFHPESDFSSMIESNQGPETCNTYNMIKLAKMLYLSNPQQKYIDYFERAMYNHILSSQHPTKGGFVYFTPMRPRHYRVYSQPQEGFWCCVGSGLENHGKYGELIYAHDSENLYVNLFIPSTLEWKEKGLSLEQTTKFPYEENSELTLKLKKAAKFSINIRYPSWVTEGRFSVLVNGKEVAIDKTNPTFASIQRKWKNGDKISFELPMSTKAEYMPDNSPWISFVHGPIVLAAKTDTTKLKGLFADGSRMGHIASDDYYPIETAPILVDASKNYVSKVVPVEGKPLTFTFSEIYPEQYKDLTLVPFYTVHEARYMIYWPVTTPEEWEKRKEDIRVKEQAMLALEAQTVDQIAPGEQQPESDHNFKAEKTESGIYNGRFWRHAEGWFSYDLKNKKNEATKLRVTYSALDKGRTFDILINDEILATVKIDDLKGSGFVDVDYELSEKMRDSDKLNLKFAAHEGSVAGGIYYIRLMK
ncbi:glycoside hydrolase family 127 protein [Flammeovirgaceae bacterium SG7u.111]|nr:glycoside hydrolase family 127 protein [Flammeovirgaceae bacterium SG7u.132]WPO36828.1 glycoside hydrolase family 127 protein [Flammeovirgaceae bacterium SG7u.111]